MLGEVFLGRTVVEIMAGSRHIMDKCGSFNLSRSYIPVASVIWPVDRVVVPEVRLVLHSFEDLLSVLVEVVAEGPNRYGSSLRSKCEESAVAGERHLGNVKDREDFGCSKACTDFIHQDGGPGQISLVGAKGSKVFGLVVQVGSVSRAERRYLDNDIKARGVDLAASCMERDVDSSTKLSGVDSEDVNLSLGGGDKKIVFAGVNIEPGNFAIVDEELHQRGLSHPVVFDFYKLESDAVGGLDRKDSELGRMILGAENPLTGSR